jgi:flagellar protein FlaG
MGDAVETTPIVKTAPPGASTVTRNEGVARQPGVSPGDLHATSQLAKVEQSKAKSAAVTSAVHQEKLESLSTLRSVNNSIEEAVEVLNEALSRKSTSASIRRDEELNRYLVTIRDKESGEVVREIPDEALLRFARNLQELKGILFDETL